MLLAHVVEINVRVYLYFCVSEVERGLILRALLFLLGSALPRLLRCLVDVRVRQRLYDTTTLNIVHVLFYFLWH